MKNSVFKSPEKRDKMRGYYNGILSRFPFGQQYVETSYGRTFMLTAGRESNPAVILIHGSNSNSAFWFPEITMLSEYFRVYAVDIIGEAGNSEEYRPDLNTDDFSNWMEEVLTNLGLEEAMIVGNSLGGWMAIKFATAYPERVSKLVLIASAGLAPVRQQFLEAVDDARQEDGTVPITDQIIGASDIPKEVLEFMNLIAESYNPIQKLPVFEDGQLLRLDMPVMFIDGEDDVIIDSRESAARLSRLNPSAKIRLIPGCGHAITNAAEYFLTFLTEKN